jgi:hypothetical protein
LPPTMSAVASRRDFKHLVCPEKHNPAPAYGSSIAASD